MKKLSEHFTIDELGVNPNNIYMPAVVYHCLLPE